MLRHLLTSAARTSSRWLFAKSNASAYVSSHRTIGSQMPWATHLSQLPMEDLKARQTELFKQVYECRKLFDDHATVPAMLANYYTSSHSTLASPINMDPARLSQLSQRELKDYEMQLQIRRVACTKEIYERLIWRMLFGKQKPQWLYDLHHVILVTSLLVLMALLFSFYREKSIKDRLKPIEKELSDVKKQVVLFTDEVKKIRQQQDEKMAELEKKLAARVN